MMNNISLYIANAIDNKNNGSPVNDAFIEIVRIYQDLVFGYVYGMLRDRSTSQDITQEVFMIAYNKLETLSNYHAFPYWIQQIARRESLRFLRQRSNRELPLAEIEERVSTVMSPDQTYEIKELQQEIQNAIAKLPENQRIPTILYYINEYSQQDIAEFLHIDLNTVKKRLQRAREQLRRELMRMIREDLQQIRPSRDGKLMEKMNLFTTFDTVAKNGQIELLEQMLVDGMDVNKRDATGKTMLHWAVANNHTDAIQLLLKSGADIHLTDKSGQSPLQLAEGKKNQSILKLLRP
jgi:RNA polymerase sigma-70 factor (ECF subfamily)